MSKSTCPIFEPTMEEFLDFRKYVEKIAPLAEHAGICKIIPPSGWFSRSYDFESLPTIDTPVKQVITGRAGVFEVNLFEISPMTPKDIFDYDLNNGYEELSYEVRERKFWKSLGCPSEWQDPVYGADVLGSLFGDDPACGWNLNRLDSILSCLGSSIPGVNSGYLYFGTWRAMFAYHTEDYDLFSINYLHSGAAKSWYAISPQNRKPFESMAESYFKQDSYQCREYLRHKTKMFSPTRLRECGISYSSVLQHQGEFVITFPGSYHAGFNHGFNVAEATNFAIASWFDVGRKARPCVCRPGAVRFNVNQLETTYLRGLLLSQKSKRGRSESTVPSHLVRMRCCCGENQAVKAIVDRQNGQLPSICSACGLSFHPYCRDKLLVHLSQLDAKIYAAKASVCHICAMLDCGSPTAETGDIFGILLPTVSPQEPTGGQTSKASGKLLVPKQSSSSNSQQKKPSGATKVHNTITVGSIVSVVLPLQTYPLIGTVTDIEDDLGRLHVKGTRKDQDVWVAIDIMKLVDEIPIPDLLLDTKTVLQSAHGKSGKSSKLSLIESKPPKSKYERQAQIDKQIPSKKREHAVVVTKSIVEETPVKLAKICARCCNESCACSTLDSCEPEPVNTATMESEATVTILPDLQQSYDDSWRLPEAILDQYWSKIANALRDLSKLQTYGRTICGLDYSKCLEINNCRKFLQVSTRSGNFDRSRGDASVEWLEFTARIQRECNKLGALFRDIPEVSEYFIALSDTISSAAPCSHVLYRCFTRILSLFVAIFPGIVAYIGNEEMKA